MTGRSARPRRPGYRRSARRKGRDLATERPRRAVVSSRRQAHVCTRSRPGAPTGSAAAWAGGGKGRMTTSEAVSYLQWRKDVAEHDYAAASSYLSIRFGEGRAQEVSKKLARGSCRSSRAVPTTSLRATGRDPLPLSDPGVAQKTWKKVLAGEEAVSGSRGGGRYRRRLPPGFPRLRARPLRGRAAQARLRNCRVTWQVPSKTLACQPESRPGGTAAREMADIEPARKALARREGPPHPQPACARGSGRTLPAWHFGVGGTGMSTGPGRSASARGCAADGAGKPQPGAPAGYAWRGACPA